MSLTNCELERGRGRWKLNSTHLERPEFKFKIQNTIHKTLNKYQNNTPHIRWEIIKCEVTVECIDFSIRIAKVNR